jgi:hypothetical protein
MADFPGTLVEHSLSNIRSRKEAFLEGWEGRLFGPVQPSLKILRSVAIRHF